MDDFLTRMYEEEMDKTAAADLEAFMGTLEADELEAVLGLSKEAVAGPEKAEEPTSAQGAELDAKQKAVRQHVENEHDNTPTQRKEMPGNVNHAGDSKAKPVTKEAMAHADAVGRLFARIKVAADPNYSVEPESWMRGQKGIARAMRAGDKGLSKYLAHDELIGARQRRGLSGALKGGAGGVGAGALAGLIASLASKGKISPGAGALGGGALGGSLGMAGGQIRGMHGADKEFLAKRGIKPTKWGLGRGRFTEEAAAKYLKEKNSMGEDEGGDAGMETTAAAKAKIAARALRATKGAPGHVKVAAIRVAAAQMASVVGR